MNALEQGIPEFEESQLQSIHCNGHWLILFEQGEATEHCPVIDKGTSFLKDLRKETTAQHCKKPSTSCSNRSWSANQATNS